MADQFHILRRRVRRLAETVGASKTLLALAVGVVVVIAILIPPVRAFGEACYASAMGQKGYVFYEINGRCSPTYREGGPANTGDLYYVGDGCKRYEQLTWGDKLRSGIGRTNLREEAFPKAKSKMLLEDGDCVIVLSGAGAVPTHAASAGWLKVATANCRLFN